MVDLREDKASTRTIRKSWSIGQWGSAVCDSFPLNSSQGPTTDSTLVVPPLVTTTYAEYPVSVTSRTSLILLIHRYCYLSRKIRGALPTRPNRLAVSWISQMDVRGISKFRCGMKR